MYLEELQPSSHFEMIDICIKHKILLKLCNQHTMTPNQNAENSSSLFFIYQYYNKFQFPVKAFRTHTTLSGT